MKASLRKEPSPHQPLPECYLVDLERYYDALKLRDPPQGSWKLGGSLLQRQVIFKTLMFHLVLQPNLQVLFHEECGGDEEGR